MKKNSAGHSTIARSSWHYLVNDLPFDIVAARFEVGKSSDERSTPSCKILNGNLSNFYILLHYVATWKLVRIDQMRYRMLLRFVA